MYRYQIWIFGRNRTEIIRMVKSCHGQWGSFLSFARLSFFARLRTYRFHETVQIAIFSGPQKCAPWFFFCLLRRSHVKMYLWFRLVLIWPCFWNNWILKRVYKVNFKLWIISFLVSKINFYYCSFFHRLFLGVFSTYQRDFIRVPIHLEKKKKNWKTWLPLKIT